MKRTIIAALLSVSFAADAQNLLVEYQGTVSSVDRASLAEAPPYSVGDSITGSFIIDTTLASADRLAAEPRIGRYNARIPGVDFILGPREPGAPGSADLLLVYDNWVFMDGAPHDGLFIRDRSVGTEGGFNLVLGLQRPNLLGQLFANDGITQSFAVQREPGTDLWGYIERGFGEFWRIANFTLDRFAVTPGVCRR
jgi:hypothetical protein